MMEKSKSLLFFIILGCSLMLSSCVPSARKQKEVAPPVPTRPNPLLHGFNEVIRFGELQEGDITEATEVAFSEAESILEGIISIPDDARTFENTMLRIDDIHHAVEMVWSPASLLGSTHPVEVIRNEGDSSSIRFEKLLNNLAVNEDLYGAVMAYSETEEAKSLDGHRKKYLLETIRDFQRSGFGLGKERREEVRRIQNELSVVVLEFSRNFSEYHDTLVIAGDVSEGLPESYLMERFREDSTYAINMSYPSYFPFMKYAKSDSAREKLSYKFLNRARNENLSLLDEMLRLRSRMAAVLDYDTFAEYRTEDRMAKDPVAVWQFEKDLHQHMLEKAEMDYQQMLNMKSEITGDSATMIHPWEKRYYENQLLLTEYAVDEEQVKQYFEIGNVIDGLFAITQRLFGLDYREVPNPSVWHEDVRMFEVFAGESMELSSQGSLSDTPAPDVEGTPRGELIGRFYLDLFPRADKYQHAAAFSVVIGKMLLDGYQKPAYALVCNFPRPADQQPSLLPHGDVETFFHEFGHLLHGILTGSALIGQAGTAVERDFVEAPSQMLENWVWNKESLSLFAKHYETGEPIPEELIDRMLSAKNLNSGTKALQQIFYGMLDFSLHDGYDPQGEETTTDVMKDLQNEITLFPYQEDTHFQASFGHLHGYAASYYGYMWSLVYAQDMFSVFEDNGVLDPETGMKFRQVVLERGGSVDPLEMVQEFLGREPNNRAFLRSLGLPVSDEAVAE
ncbi:MAG: M3 family metallopeptidase [Candidatus Neomarinimicrobiota bacterium]